MDASFDLAGMMRDLIAFRENIRFHLTAQQPMPENFSSPLWEAHRLVDETIEGLKAAYGVQETGWTVYSSDPPEA